MSSSESADGNRKESKIRKRGGFFKIERGVSHASTDIEIKPRERERGGSLRVCHCYAEAENEMKMRSLI